MSDNISESVETRYDEGWAETKAPKARPNMAKAKAKARKPAKAKTKRAKKERHPWRGLFAKARARRELQESKNRILQTATSTSKPVSVPIGDIVAGPNRRKVDQEAVMTIAASMEELGQLQPVMIRQEKKKARRSLKASTALVVVDGWHRILAAKSLGWDSISAVHFRGDRDAARVYELTQNLQRASNTVAYRAVCLAELVRRILGESQAKELAQPGGRQPGDKGIGKAARVLGYTRDDIRRSTQIASISIKAMTRAEKLGLDDNQAALLQIAKERPEEQVAKAEELGTTKKGAKKPADAASREADEATFAELEAAWENSTECQRAFGDATENARRKFYRLLQGVPLPGKKKKKAERD
jgi:ParB-like chromosome segregation protein Spo0J